MRGAGRFLAAVAMAIPETRQRRPDFKTDRPAQAASRDGFLLHPDSFPWLFHRSNRESPIPRLLPVIGNKLGAAAILLPMIAGGSPAALTKADAGPFAMHMCLRFSPRLVAQVAKIDVDQRQVDDHLPPGAAVVLRTTSSTGNSCCGRTLLPESVFCR